MTPKPKYSEIFATLTDRERQIAQLVCEGLSDREIGHQMNLSEDSVKAHLRDIYQKLVIVNRAALAALAKPSGK